MRARWIFFVLLAVPGELIATSGAATGLVPTNSHELGSECQRSIPFREGDVRRPGRAELISPSGVIEDSRPTFAWQAVRGAEEYYLEIRGRRLELLFRSWFRAETICGQDGMCQVPAALSEVTLPDGRYDWWVRAANFAGSGPRSRAIRVRLQPLPTP